MRHWPLDPLLALARNRDGERMSKVELSKLLGFSEGTVQGWHRSGIPGDEKAERAAVALGFDPANVWPDWYDVQESDLSQPCAYCAERFVPSRKGNIYCSRRCQTLAYKRARYRRDPEHREQVKAKSRAFYIETAEYQRARKRREYAANPDRKKEMMRTYRRRLKAQGEQAA